VASFGDGVLRSASGGQLRRVRLAAEVGEPTAVADGPVVRLTHVTTTEGPLIAALAEEGTGTRLVVVPGEKRSDFLTGRSRLVFGAPRDLPFEALAPGTPDYLEATGSGSDVLVGWRSGELLRVRVGRADDSFVAERGRLVPEGVELTALRFLLGNRTLVWGDSQGAVHAGFLIRTADFAGDAGLALARDPRATSLLVRTKRLFGGDGHAVSALAPSARSRLLFMGFADGRVRLANVTNETLLGSVRLAAAAPVAGLVTAPKDDAVVAFAGAGFHVAGFDAGHPEASFSALFRPVWYEGYIEPAHVWQSSGGSDDFEPKLGLYPLVFGTVKATFYSMLFGAPLALLAALFTSEFLSARAKAVIKPSIELMASLPSVVLGFLAALVFAPFVEEVLPATIALAFTLPLAFLTGAHVWQLLPAAATRRYQRWRFAAVAAAAPAGVAAAVLAGPVLEDVLFAGDFKAWLAWEPETRGDSRFASATGGLTLLLLPFAALAVAWASGRLLGRWRRAGGAGRSRGQLSRLEAARFVLGGVLALGLAFAAAALAGALGLDPRGGLVDVYVQRNALVVGFVMGFAVIPIIYTLAEDALSAVPDHLRSASLGAGATTWQTAVRIVVPTAMSGLFSAVMVGLGRAVGETMIVLMAAGNTPILEWNVFEGFRTLSANIAVELPEAVKGSTHYRTLFLAALVLFAMTFVVNTVAEVVRQRFRKRAYQL
jgi:phosphate transport system permease protein